MNGNGLMNLAGSKIHDTNSLINSIIRVILDFKFYVMISKSGKHREIKN